MKIEFEKALFIGPHADDIEFGCGATLSRITRESRAKIRMLILTSREKTTGERFEDAVRYQYNAASVFGIPSDAVVMGTFMPRFLPDYCDEIRSFLKQHKEEFAPDIVFTTTFHDRMQDHHAVADETYRVFRDTTLLEYEVISSSLNFQPQVYVGVEEEDIERKIKALHCFLGQCQKDYFDPDVIRSLARLRGTYSKRFRFAEGFVVRNMVI